MFLAMHVDPETPVMIDFSGCKVVPLFDTELSLQAVMKHIAITEYEIVTVGHGPSFLQAVMESGYHLAFNVHVAPLNSEGGIAPLRYTLVKLYPENLQ
jgi:hypothetical protein